MNSPQAHQRAATRQLRTDIETGKVKSSMFTEAQLSDIRAGDSKIEGYTWHHHQDQGRMQLVREEIHQSLDHIGGNAMWGKLK